MKAIERIREYESQWGNLDFKTYNRDSMGCEMLENAEKEKLNLINKYDYNILILEYITTILNDDLMVEHYELYGVLELMSYLEPYYLDVESLLYDPPIKYKESIEAVNNYGEAKHKVIMKNNYITAPFEIYKEAYIRHYTCLKLGEKIDESGLPHEYHCWWNIVAMVLIKLYKDNTIYYMLEKSND